MNKDKLFSIVRILFTIGGALLLGRNIGGQVVDQNFIQIVLGVALALAGLVWSFVDQTSTLESFQAITMQVFTFFGGFLLSSGKINAEQLSTWGGIVAMVASIVYPILSRKKSQAIADGKIPIEALKGVNEDGAPQKAITPVLNMVPPKDNGK